MKLISLSEYIINIHSDVEYKEKSFEDAYIDILSYTQFLRKQLEIEMFIGPDKIFAGKFSNSSCWDAGYDSSQPGDYVLFRGEPRPPYSTREEVLGLYNRDIAWFIKKLGEDAKFNDRGIVALNTIKLDIENEKYRYEK